MPKKVLPRIAAVVSRQEAADLEHSLEEREESRVDVSRADRDVPSL
jgi:hypothetical protein